MMEDDKVEAHMCYVFIEDETHDLKWATMLDYENNMRDDQADEKTAAVYIRTMPQSDGELYRKGLLCNATKSKRGIFIGRHARQNLFDMFMDDKVSAKDAEVICQLTQNLRDEARVEEIQSRAASLLKDGKSWEYIGAMTQLLANKERVTMRQGLLDLGADFEADLEKMARCVELNMQALKESVGLLKQGRRLSKEKRAQAERLGLVTQTSEDSEGKLAALTGELTRWEYIGSYPDLIAAVQMWDGETVPDPVGRVLEAYERERAQAGEEEQRGQGYVPEGQGGFDFSASVSPTLREDVSKAQERKLKAREVVRVSGCPPVLVRLGERDVDVVTTARVLYKLKNEHGLDVEDVMRVVSGMGEPVFVIRDTEGSYILFPGVMARNNNGEMAHPSQENFEGG